jgi:hypothetical protein
MGEVLTIGEARELIKLCQAGWFYAVRDWIAAGKPIRTSPEIKKTILSVAIKTGFHSLVELIAPYEPKKRKTGVSPTRSNQNVSI